MRAGSLAAVLVLAPLSAAAQQRVVIQGLADAEAWRTTGGSRLLSRNGDRALLAGRLNLWAAARLTPELLLIAHGEGSAGGGEGEVLLRQLVARWSPARSLALEAGRFPSPVGGFAPRRLPNANPLIGVPDLYPVSYPWGVLVTGVAGPVDYRAGLVDRPSSDERYVPAGGSRLRPAAGLGLTPAIGFRLGASATKGPYLTPAISGSLPAGAAWSDYGQQILAFDGAFSRGYLELRAEAAFSSYDVPGHDDPVRGQAVYVEAKYTWSPRFFTAVRLERNRYAFIRPETAGTWMGVATAFVDGELAIGYRFDHQTLFKVSARLDDWDVPPAMRSILPNGSAFALQVSREFDLTAALR